MTFLSVNGDVWIDFSKFSGESSHRFIMSPAHFDHTGDVSQRYEKGARFLCDSGVSLHDVHHFSCVRVVRWLTARPSCCWLRLTLWRSWASSWDPPSRSPTPFLCSKAQTKDWSDPSPFARGHHLVPNSFCFREEEEEEEIINYPEPLFSYVWCPVPIRERERERGIKQKELGQRDIFLSNRRWLDWYGSWIFQADALISDRW